MENKRLDFTPESICNYFLPNRSECADKVGSGVVHWDTLTSTVSTKYVEPEGSDGKKKAKSRKRQCGIQRMSKVCSVTYE